MIAVHYMKIIELIELADNDPRPTVPGRPDRLWYLTRFLSRKVKTIDLIEALKYTTQSMVIQTILQILWTRCEDTVAEAIIPYIQDLSSAVSAVAIDALYHLGDRRATMPLLNYFNDKDAENDISSTIVLALGSVQCYTAVPRLINLLQSGIPSIRSAAAWSLGVLGAQEAESALRDADFHESVRFVKTQIEGTLTTLELISDVKEATDVVAVLTLLATNLSSESAQLRIASARLLGELASVEAKAHLEVALSKEKECTVARRIAEALIATKMRLTSDEI